jgi:hypothetical protein
MSRVRDSVTNNNVFWTGWLDLLALLYNYNQLQQLTIDDCLRLAPFLTGPRVSSLLVCVLLWRTWFWFTNHSFLPRMTYESLRTNKEWRRSLHGCSYSLAVTMENVCCLSVDTETRSVPSRFPGIHISIATCIHFAATLLFARVYSFQVSYPLKSLSNTQRRFVQDLYLRGNLLANS